MRVRVRGGSLVGRSQVNLGSVVRVPGGAHIHVCGRHIGFVCASMSRGNNNVNIMASSAQTTIPDSDVSGLVSGTDDKMCQQTLRRSFVRVGTGLHSGTTVAVRVRPARAGEGRYFVRVDSQNTFDETTGAGANDVPEWVLTPPSDDNNAEHGESDDERELKRIFALLESENAMLDAEARGELKWIHHQDEEGAASKRWRSESGSSEIKPFDNSLPHVTATLDRVSKEELRLSTRLLAKLDTFETNPEDPVMHRLLRERPFDRVPASYGEDMTVKKDRIDAETGRPKTGALPVDASNPLLWSPSDPRLLHEVSTCEHLLSALQMCGIDNARIELYGTGYRCGDFQYGFEMPLLDGSALEWARGIAHAGLAPARDEDGNTRQRLVMKVKETISVRRGDAFVTAYPSDVLRVSYGIDFSARSRAIGTQWFSWSPVDSNEGSSDPASLLDAASSPESWALAQDNSYLNAVAPARTFCLQEDVEAMLEAGLIQGASARSALVAGPDTWLNPDMLRFRTDEPARHKVLDLLGDLSLLGARGQCGVPVAHIVAYRAGHELHRQFALELLSAWEDGAVEWVTG